MATIPINLSSNIDIFNTNDIFDDIEDIADLTLPFFNFNNMESYYERPQSKPTSSKGHGNMDFEVSNIVDEILRIEND
ncbi:11778_t:CDS:2, partial [Dentiscutata heterogama]